MRKFVVLLSALLIAGTVPVASAKSSHARTSSAHIKANMTGAPSSGACSTTGYSSHCPSDNCECEKFFGFVNGNQAGKGTATIQLTVDNGSTTSSPAGCEPVFGTATLAATKDNNQTLSIVGALCDGKNAKAKNLLNGGYGITSSDQGFDGAGSFDGTISANGTLDVKLSGFVQPF